MMWWSDGGDDDHDHDHDHDDDHDNHDDCKCGATSGLGRTCLNPVYSLYIYIPIKYFKIMNCYYLYC